ncbi:MAG: hypothetical protein MUO76_15615, partial [Anaerolineaceae bacterium]|nr:hypothetical protein [Anaerolineaceae bacterium]
LWLFACLLPFLFIQRRMHQELQMLFLIITRRPAFSLGLFSILFFPGVFLHEISHFLMAKVLWVQTRRFSLLPEASGDGKLRLGYVEVARVDVLRNALIGAAPLVSGGVLVTYLSSNQLDLLPLINLVDGGDWMKIYHFLVELPRLTDFWLWFYVVFTVSSTMLPSPSDRRSWLSLSLVVLGLVGLAIAAGAGTWMAANLMPWFTQVLDALALVFGLSLLIHLALLLPVGLLRILLSRLAGVRALS